MWGKQVSFSWRLLCPMMLFPLLCWAEICLLLLGGACQPEETEIGLKEAVQSDSVIAAALGGEANFYCNFSLSMDVLQVTWQKRNGSSFQNIATYSPNHGLRLIGSFQEKARFTRATLKASAFTLQNLTFKDESYYRCIFNVFPHGSFSQDIFLNIQSISDLTVEYDTHLPSEDLLTAVCSATGKPAPSITWLDDRDLDECSEIRHIQNADGTVTVTNRLTCSANNLRVLVCLLDHPQGRKTKAVYLEKGRQGVQKNTIIMAVLITVVSLTMIYSIMKLINRQRKNLKRCIAPRTSAKEEGLHQDLSEKTVSPRIPKDQHIVYQKQEQTPGSSIHKTKPRLKTHLREKKICSRLFSEEVENLNGDIYSVFEVPPLGLCVKDLGCTSMKEYREATAGGGAQTEDSEEGAPYQASPRDVLEISSTSGSMCELRQVTA